MADKQKNGLELSVVLEGGKERHSPSCPVHIHNGFRHPEARQTIVGNPRAARVRSGVSPKSHFPDMRVLYPLSARISDNAATLLFKYLSYPSLPFQIWGFLVMVSAILHFTNLLANPPLNRTLQFTLMIFVFPRLSRVKHAR
jgi:hypothetical protein